MKRLIKFAIWIAILGAVVQWTIVLAKGIEFPVLNPKGIIGLKERNLIVLSLVLMCLVVIPAIAMTFFIAWKYREDNPKAKYSPDWAHSHLAEAIWWGVPFIIIIFLSVITWNSSHELDPFKPIGGEKKPMTIQAIALRWKWLFIYPEQGIATVNYVEFPEKTPLVFEITADAPMNSFWIPQLGGQIYAMPGMKTKLHLIANETGEFRGSSANLSGKGFASMVFKAISATEEAFSEWVSSTKGSPVLTQESYEELSKPSSYVLPETYVLGDEGLFERIAMKPMMKEHK